MTAGQSASASAFESLTGTIVGFLLSVWVQRFLFPALGYELALIDNFMVATVFTLISFLRGYVIRRTFNALRDQLP
ncbi:DUF7220 family protein [Tabrizicola soli]|uniref:Uncharacterized protein n=1 Tax=Tabrizicola soli TaxID=2185115 RepID=A0ABV7DV70_9RHOB|nr:hypothetical protein [Tabrizicola soli]